MPQGRQVRYGGKTHTFPTDASNEEIRAALEEDALRTGAGMEGYAQQQARQSLSNATMPWNSPEEQALRGKESERRRLIGNVMLGGAGALGAGTLVAAFPPARGIAGMIGGDYLAKKIGIPPWIGAVGGGALASGGALPGYLRGILGGGSAAAATEAAPAETLAAKAGARVPKLLERIRTPKLLERIVKTPEEFAAEDQRMKLVEQMARRKGMQSAGYGERAWKELVP